MQTPVLTKQYFFPPETWTQCSSAYCVHSTPRILLQPVQSSSWAGADTAGTGTQAATLGMDGTGHRSSQPCSSREVSDKQDAVEPEQLGLIVQFSTVACQTQQGHTWASSSFHSSCHSPLSLGISSSWLHTASLSSSAVTFCRPGGSATGREVPGGGRCPGPQHPAMPRHALGQAAQGNLGAGECFCLQTGPRLALDHLVQTRGLGLPHTPAAPTWQFPVALPWPEVHVLRVSSKDYQLLVGAHKNMKSLDPAQRKSLKILRKQDGVESMIKLRQGMGGC